MKESTMKVLSMVIFFFCLLMAFVSRFDDAVTESCFFFAMAVVSLALAVCLDRGNFKD